MGRVAHMQDTVGPDLQSRADPLDDLGVRASGFFFFKDLAGVFLLIRMVFFGGAGYGRFAQAFLFPSFFIYERHPGRHLP
jgi:hypothetical protein